MKLTKLDVLGFKSFKDKTPLDFSQGISAIVGPNGCGKSNVVDAIRWVMGEQRFTVLRGKKMDDVIFNGSDDALPVGMAEVTMTLDSNGKPFPGQYAELSEITITRRIFREGETEYYINKMPCRLLDIREFFMDAGVGARTYSIVEQERVSRLIEAKPQERREFIEEAAGIVKYKSRREAAIRKMEATRLNLTRLNDILREVKSQLNATARQARRAEQFKAMRQEVKEAKITLALQTYTDLLAQNDTLSQKRRSLEEDATTVDTRLKSAEAAIEEVKALIADSDALIAGLQERFYGLKQEIVKKEQGIGFSKETVTGLTERKSDNEREIEALHRRKESTGEELAQLNVQIAESAERVIALKEKISELQAVVDALAEEEKLITGRVEQEKSSHIDTITEVARLKNLQASLAKGIEDLKGKTGKEEKEIEEKQALLASLEDALTAERHTLTTEAARREALTGREEGLARELEELKCGLASIIGAIDEMKEGVRIKSSRLASLEELEERHEWCNEGTRSILRAAHERVVPTCEIHGLVADYISVPKEYEHAVEAALGEKLQYVIVESQQDGVQAIDFLKHRASGRSSFIPLDFKIKSPDCRHPEHLRDAVRLADHVTVTKQEFSGIINYLLQDVLVISDLPTAMNLWKMNGFTGTYVTPEGDIITPGGELAGGSDTNGDGSLLRNKREIIDLRKEVNERKSLLANKTGEMQKLEAAIITATDSLAGTRSEIHTTELAINGTRKDIERLEGESRWAGQGLNVSLFNRENLSSDEKEALERISGIGQELALLDATMVETNRRIEVLIAEWTKAKQDLSLRERELVEHKIEFASLDEKTHAAATTVTRLETALGEIEETIAANRRDSETCDAKIAELTLAIEKDEHSLTAHYAGLDGAESALAAEKEVLAGNEQVLREREADTQKERKACDAVVRELNEVNLEIRETEVKTESLRGGIRESLYVELAELLPLFERLDDTATEEIRAKLEENEQKIAEFGEVNLLALGEHEELKNRHEFLSTQVRDLTTSIDTLQKTITKINQISRTRFAETFESVNNHFREVFPRLFPGGKGHLILTDETDLLETGVDIEIQIPGKRRQNLSLLSGGEKALSAVSLIFAILLHRPTPFLVLDEADAPLDDANTALFRQLVRDVAQNSQVILITHNKRTMEVADNLIGVTMEKKGISSIVSVNLN